MQKGPKIALASAGLFIVVVGALVGNQYRKNHEQGPVAKNPYPEQKLDPDDLVFLKKERPDSIKDERALIGTTVWVSAGGQLDYYVDKDKHVDYAKPVGTLLGATPLDIKDVFEEKAPASGPAVMRIPAGEKHVLLAFTLPNSSDPKTLYATPVGDYDNGLYTMLNDEIFFYDDPHQLYKHWGAATWAHIDKHEVVPGMSENQTMMALGQVMKPDSDNTGDRDVTYDNNGHPITVEFVHNKAVKITPEK
ncbi:MAG: hypothetical protein HIU91_04480 [Acidobacteria bacterium]|nr:hypothetical protein [Acidobacteriota bacterium]